jgi:glycerate kinase
MGWRSERPLRVLLIPDKFKGTLGAREAAEAMAAGWRRARPQDTLTLQPMSDGGDGFGQILSDLLGAYPQVVNTVDAAHRPCQARWWWDAKSSTAIIESARVIGLAMLPPGKYHPFALDTFRQRDQASIFPNSLDRWVPRLAGLAHAAPVAN